MKTKKYMEHQFDSIEINNQLVCNFRDIGHTIRHNSDGKGSQQRILIILNKHQKMTQKELTERLCIQPGSVSEVIGKLENVGYVIKSQSEEDKRTINLEITELGSKKAKEALDNRNKRHQEMFTCLSDDEKEVLLNLLEKINDDWENRYNKEKCKG